MITIDPNVELGDQKTRGIEIEFEDTERVPRIDVNNNAR